VCLFLVLPSAEQNEVESIRLRTADYEMVIAQHGNFTVVVIQEPSGKEAVKVVEVGEKKEGEAEAKKEG
jgi:hypothetical protein